jgi:hypothetical protein
VRITKVSERVDRQVFCNLLGQYLKGKGVLVEENPNGLKCHWEEVIYPTFVAVCADFRRVHIFGSGHLGLDVFIDFHDPESFPQILEAIKLDQKETHKRWKGLRTHTKSIVRDADNG